MHRRSFLKGAGAVTVLVAGGSVWRAEDQGVFSAGEGRAFQPWKDWQKDAGAGPLGLVRAAILAASPHNTQPWLFRIANSTIELYVDAQRSPGALDPYFREQHISLGCALENLMLAAGAYGYSASATLLPGKLASQPAAQREFVARVELAPGPATKNALYDAIPHRHTNRNPYQPNRPLSPAFAQGVMDLASGETDVRIFLFSGESDRRKIAEMVSAANDALYADPTVERDSGRWIRPNWREVEEHRDGLTLDCAGLPPVDAAILKFAPTAVFDQLRSHSQGFYIKHLLTIPMFGLIAVHDRYDQPQALRAGRIWQRAHLFATSQQLAAQPANEAVEMVDHERILGRAPQHAGLLAQLTGDEAWQPTFTFCMGHAIRPAPASPRRPVRDVVL